ncbi:MAG: hypothetical protein K6F79_09975 [Saccharofermentans sp.]|nr:hypothetical protein [Saccharofermentans sp.]
MKRIYSTKINERPMVVNILESLLLFSIVFTIGFFYYYKSKLISMYPSETPSVDCSDNLNDLVQCYNDNGKGQMRIINASMRENGDISAHFEVEGIDSIPEANEAFIFIEKYMQENEEALLSHPFYLDIDMINLGPFNDDVKFAPISLHYEIAGLDATYVSAVDLSEACITNSIDTESIPLNIDKVYVYTLEISDAEMEYLQQNYPDAEIVF